MGYALRDRDPSVYFFITIRTEEQRFYMRPSKDVNKTIGGVIARYQEIFGVEIIAYCVMSNHIHLLVRAPRGNLDEFMECVDREVARRINFKNRRLGKFWSKRYKPQAILTDKDLTEAFVYVVTNPVKHGAATHPSLWPGLCSYQQNLSEKPKTYSFHHYSAADYQEAVTNHQLTISPFPLFKDMPKLERIKATEALIDARATFYQDDRKANGLGFLPLEKVKAIDPYYSPKERVRSSTGSCYSKDPEIIKEHRKAERERRTSYDLASMRFRLGEWTVEFPIYTFKPTLHRKPRIVKFTPLPDNYFLQKNY